jgi:hypothetical protein
MYDAEYESVPNLKKRMYVINEEERNMKITKNDYETFICWAQEYFIRAREAKSEHALEVFKEKFPKATKRMGKAAKQTGLKAYIGRSIFRNIPWLQNIKGKWRVAPGENYCAYCLNELDEEIYLFDMNDRYYCDDECLEELFSLMNDLEDDEKTSHLVVEVEEPWDSFWEDCQMLFIDFQQIKPEARGMLGGTIEPIAKKHLDLLLLIQKIEYIIYSGDYDDIWMNGGDDGPSASHMYKMLKSLEKDLEKLKELEENIKENRKDEKFTYRIYIDEKSSSENSSPSMISKLKHKYKEQINELSTNIWEVYEAKVERDIMKCIKEARLEATSKWLSNCHLCNGTNNDNNIRMIWARDDYYYCDECYMDYYEEFKQYSARGDNW